MRDKINLKSLLDAVNVPADWVGIREVYESNTPRMISCLLYTSPSPRD